MTVHVDDVSLSARLTAVLGAALVVSSCGGRTHDNPPHPTRTDEPVVTGEPADHNAADAGFVDNMIAQDQQGMDMSALVPDRAANPQFVALAASSGSACQSDVAILRVLRVQWNANSDIEGSHAPGKPIHGISQATIAKLQSSHGGPFETLWLQSMIGLDQGTIEMANAEIANGKNVDAVDVAKQIVEARRTEIDQMKKMSGA